MIRIGIVDDHRVVRAGVRAYLSSEPDLLVTGEAADGADAIDLVRNQELHVLLMDLSMPRQSGWEVLSIIRAKAPELGILIFTGHSEAQYAAKLMRCGAAGFLTKDGDPAMIPKAIRVVAAGRRFITPSVAELMAKTKREPSEEAPHQKLTKREFQVFLKLAQGAKALEISRQLFIAPKTVAVNRARIAAKLGASTDSELTYYALKHGLID